MTRGPAKSRWRAPCSTALPRSIWGLRTPAHTPIVLAVALSLGLISCGDDAALARDRAASETTGLPRSSTTTVREPTTLVTTTSVVAATTSAVPISTSAPAVTAAPAATAPVTATVPPTTAAPPAPPIAPPTVGAGQLRGAFVVVDPGHNGKNGSHTAEITRQVDAGGFMKDCNTTGTAGGSYSEAQFNFEVALRVKASLEAAGATVLMTRADNNGWGPCIDERGQLAATNNADLLVSIHADGSSAGHRGFHIIYPPAITGYTDRSATSSKAIAIALRDALVAGGFSASNYIGSAGLDERGDLGTLNRAEVPAVILESGNMRDAQDLALLKSADGQQRIATAITNAVAAYLHL